MRQSPCVGWSLEERRQKRGGWFKGPLIGTRSDLEHDEQDDDLDEELGDSLDEGIDEYGAPKAPIVTLEDLDSYGSPLGDALDSYGSPAAPVKGNVVISVSKFLYTFIYI